MLCVYIEYFADATLRMRTLFGTCWWQSRINMLSTYLFEHPEL